MDWQLEYLSPDGQVFDLLRGGVRIEIDSLDGFVGLFEDSPVDVVGVPGSFIDFRDRRVMPLTGSFTAVVFDVDEWVRWRRAWSTTRRGTLRITPLNDLPKTLSVTLANALPSPVVRPKPGERIDVSVISFQGAWQTAFSATGNVTVTNDGDVPIWPKIAWSGAGGTVTLPSGATFSLPSVSGEYEISLRRGDDGKATKNGEVTDINVDSLAESVPVGQTRLFKLPAGAHLNWSVGVFDPWI